MREQRSELPSGRFSIAERIVDESLKILCLLRDDAAQWSTRVAGSTEKPSKLSLRLVTTEIRSGVDDGQAIFRSLQPILSIVSTRGYRKCFVGVFSELATFWQRAWKARQRFGDPTPRDEGV